MGSIKNTLRLLSVWASAVVLSLIFLVNMIVNVAAKSNDIVSESIKAIQVINTTTIASTNTTAPLQALVKDLSDSTVKDIIEEVIQGLNTASTKEDKEKILRDTMNALSLKSDLAHTQSEQKINWYHTVVFWYSFISAGLLLVVFWFLSKRITTQLINLNKDFGSVAKNITSGVEELTSSSSGLADSSTKQAASLEETAASLEEISSMVRQTADNAQHAKSLTSEVVTESSQGTKAIEQMLDAMEAIRKASDETATIIKTIDEIAFQTNLLALNAAVEAARAGDAGKGFAVVADEVRALAARSSKAAKDTSEKISRSQEFSKNGVIVSGEVKNSLERIQQKISNTSSIINEIAAATVEQSSGLKEINKAANDLDSMTQRTSAQAEQIAAASHQLLSQAKIVESSSNNLEKLIGIKMNQDAKSPLPSSMKKSDLKKLPLHSKSVQKKVQQTKKETVIKELSTDITFGKKIHLKKAPSLRPDQIIPLDDGDFNGF